MRYIKSIKSKKYRRMRRLDKIKNELVDDNIEYKEKTKVNPVLERIKSRVPKTLLKELEHELKEKNNRISCNRLTNKTPVYEDIMREDCRYNNKGMEIDERNKNEILFNARNIRSIKNAIKFDESNLFYINKVEKELEQANNIFSFNNNIVEYKKNTKDDKQGTNQVITNSESKNNLTRDFQQCNKKSLRYYVNSIKKDEMNNDLNIFPKSSNLNIY